MLGSLTDHTWVGILPDFEFDRLDALRNERNRVAHDRHTMEWGKLRGHEFFVHRQLDAWGLIPDVETYNATLNIGDWQEHPKHWKREIWAGVHSSSSTRAWGFTLTETANTGPGIDRPEDSNAFGCGEEPAQWDTMCPPDDDAR